MNAKDFIMQQPQRLTVAAVCEKHQFEPIDYGASSLFKGWQRNYNIRVGNGWSVAGDEPFILAVNYMVDPNAWDDGYPWQDVTIECYATGHRKSRKLMKTELGAAKWLDRTLTGIEHLIEHRGQRLSSRPDVLSVDSLTFLMRNGYGFK